MQLLIDETAELFKTSEQWDNYLELVDLKGDIIEGWRDSVEKQVVEFFRKPVNEIDGYSFSKSSCFDWYVEGYDNAFAISVWDFRDFGLWVDEGKIDCDKANELVKEEKYKEIWKPFRNDEESDEDWIYYEKGNFHFDDARHNGNFEDEEEFIWYTYHRFNEYVEQIIEKLDLFCTEENRQLLKKLYKEVRK
jgi:hypothetical protein